MHELSICRALIAQVTQVARENGACLVDEIVLDVGPLSGVVPDLLASAFVSARAGTVAEDATLTVVPAPVKVWCPACELESAASLNSLLCARCGNWQTTLRSGDELLLRSVVLSDDRDPEGAMQPEPAHV